MAIHRLSHGRTFDSDTGEVRSGARTTRLEPQPAALLDLLLRRAGVLVTHAEIRACLWSDGRHVDYTASVHYAVRQVRRALDAEAPRADIETIPRRGYRVRRQVVVGGASDLPGAADAVEVHREPSDSGEAPRTSGGLFRRLPSGGSPWRARLVRGVALAVLVAAIVAIERRPNQHHELAVRFARAVHATLFER